jgi:hypothetical protein
MAQLADRVRQVERLKSEKARNTKFHKKEKIAYVGNYDSDNDYDFEGEEAEENEIHLAELKPGPPYTCKLLKPSNGKNPVEPKNDKYVAKTYTFDVTKCDEIFDLLVTDGQIIVQRGLKVPALEQRKKRGYCKFHNFLGHKTSHCVVFRDLVQKALNEGRLKFDEKSKPPMKVDAEPLQVAETSYVEPFKCLMVDAMEASPVRAMTEREYEEKVKSVYPQAEEELIDFLNRCKLSNTKVMLCPRCSAVCDKEATAGLRNVTPYVDNRTKWSNARPYQSMAVNQGPTIHDRLGRKQTFVPSNRVPINQWSSGQHQAYQKRKMDIGSSSHSASSNTAGVRKYSYYNYKGKNPMTRTQWRRYQRQKKLERENSLAGGNSNTIAHAGGNAKIAHAGGNNKVAHTEGNQVDAGNKKQNVPNKAEKALVIDQGSSSKRHVKERISFPDDNIGDDVADEDLLESGSEPDFDVLVNVVSILPREYDVRSTSEPDEDFVEPELDDYTPVCFYVMNNGCIEQQKAVFERPHEGMKSHLKPLYIKAKIGDVGVNKVLVDGGAAVNLMPHFMLKRLGMYDTDMHSHNIVLSNYEGKSGQSLGAIQMDVAVGSTIRPTLFIVVPSRASFNILLGREWIHGVGAVPSTLHQRLILWREDNIIENIEADQSFYMSEVDHITKKTFDKNLALIAPCGERDSGFRGATDNVYHSVRLHPTHGFCWDREEIDDFPPEDGVIPPSGWDDEDPNHD